MRNEEPLIACVQLEGALTDGHVLLITSFNKDETETLEVCLTQGHTQLESVSRRERCYRENGKNGGILRHILPGKVSSRKVGIFACYAQRYMSEPRTMHEESLNM